MGSSVMSKHRKNKTHRSKKRQPLINPNFTWEAVDPQTKKALIIGISLLFSLTSMIAGTQFMLMLAMAIGIVSYGVFGDEFVNWFNQHEYLLIGATFGLIATNFNPFGLFLGLWSGYFVNRKLNQIFEFGSNVAEKVNPIVQPFGYTASKLNQLFQYTKNQCFSVLNWNTKDTANFEHQTLKIKPKKKKHLKKIQEQEQSQKRTQENPQEIQIEIRDRIRTIDTSLNEINVLDQIQEPPIETSEIFAKQFELSQENIQQENIQQENIQQENTQENIQSSPWWKQCYYNSLLALSLCGS